MRQQRTRATSAHDQDVEGDRDQLHAWLAGEDEPSAPAAHPPERLGGPGRRREVDWDNDATTHFRRDPSDANWAGDLGKLLEPSVFPSEPPVSLEAQEARSLRTSLDARELAVEGGLTRSMPPRHTKWSRSMWFILPMLGVLGLIGIGASRGVRATDLRALAAFLPEPLARYVSPRAPAAPPRAIAVRQPDPEPIGPEPMAAEPEAREKSSAEPAEAQLALPAAVQVIVTRAGGSLRSEVTTPRERRESRAETRRRNREKRRVRSDALARPITPLRDAEPTPATQAANTGVLQINSRPWARVFVDGQFVGHTPQRALQLAPGRHRIRLINEPLEMSKNISVVIVSGQTVTRIELLEDDPSVSR